MPDNDVAFTGSWTINTNDITYAYTGTVPAGAPTEPSGETGVAYGTPKTVESAPTLTGYTFSGWATADATVTDGDFNMPDNDVAFTGSWTPINYTITYVLNGGTNHPSNPSTYTIESPNITLQNPSRPNYVFIRWTEGDMITQGSTGNKTFTAEWTNSEFVIIFAAGDHGYFIDSGVEKQEIAQTVAYNAMPTDPQGFLYGYGDWQFDGWVPAISAATSSLTYTAQWSMDPTVHIVSYTVRTQNPLPNGKPGSEIIYVEFLLSNGNTVIRSTTLADVNNHNDETYSWDPVEFNDIEAGEDVFLSATVIFTTVVLKSAGLVAVSADVIDHSRDLEPCDHEEGEHIAYDSLLFDPAPVLIQYDIGQGGSNQRAAVTVTVYFTLSNGLTVTKQIILHGLDTGVSPDKYVTFSLGCYEVTVKANATVSRSGSTMSLDSVDVAFVEAQLRT